MNANPYKTTDANELLAENIRLRDELKAVRLHLANVEKGLKDAIQMKDARNKPKKEKVPFVFRRWHAGTLFLIISGMCMTGVGFCARYGDQNLVIAPCIFLIAVAIAFFAWSMTTFFEHSGSVRDRYS